MIEFVAEKLRQSNLERRNRESSYLNYYNFV